MGLFDKIKQAGRMLTGGGAKVQVEIGEAQIGAPTTVIVKVVVADADLSVDAVYLRVRAQEVVEIDREELARKFSHDQGTRHHGTAVFKETTFDERINLSGAQTLAAGSEVELDGSFELPVGYLPSFSGRMCKHRWQVLAGLDVTGNDPDSGWVEFRVRG